MAECHQSLQTRCQRCSWFKWAGPGESNGPSVEACKEDDGHVKNVRVTCFSRVQWVGSLPSRHVNSAATHRLHPSPPHSSATPNLESMIFMRVIGKKITKMDEDTWKLTVMRGKGNQNQDEEEYEEDEFSSRKDGPSSSFTVNNNNSSKDGKSNDKANAIRSKHSVTEQRRRSKINERFQILRDIVPHSDQKRDTASFLLEVIEYVQYLQQKVQKYEGPYQGWSSEPAKLMPWRNSHWRLQSFGGHPQAIKNGSVPGETFPGKLDENNIALTPATLPSTPNLVESDHVACKVLEHQPDLANKVMPLPTPAPIQSVGPVAHPCQLPVSDAQSAECPITSEMLNQQDLAIEAGTINISSAYSQECIYHKPTSQFRLILENERNRGLTSGTLTSKDPQNPHPSKQTITHLREASGGEDSDQAHKRLKDVKAAWDLSNFNDAKNDCDSENEPRLSEHQ
ncbi:BES1-INTERACTING MYC-LIKE PROTEIN [Salix koriyanagi]|uniref:BES1-INTERACTING MYC-LIKE PROTEIN n=1 Tax=Salix koriyanagi TaxID=2511006 RepID=A0A9Q0WJY0_9ROSI|nr:BES1-INTERACTING MYC-LIKE PROTEIN [Salix koriyanagi]